MCAVWCRYVFRTLIGLLSLRLCRVVRRRVLRGLVGDMPLFQLLRIYVALRHELLKRRIMRLNLDDFLMSAFERKLKAGRLSVEKGNDILGLLGLKHERRELHGAD